MNTLQLHTSLSCASQYVRGKLPMQALYPVKGTKQDRVLVHLDYHRRSCIVSLRSPVHGFLTLSITSLKSNGAGLILRYTPLSRSKRFGRIVCDHSAGERDIDSKAKVVVAFSECNIVLASLPRRIFVRGSSTAPSYIDYGMRSQPSVYYFMVKELSVQLN